MLQGILSTRTSRDWKIGKCRRYFEEISDIGRRRNDNRHRLSIDGKIDKKSAKSPIYRRNIGEIPIYRKISRYFPTSPARAQDTKSGSKIVDLGFVKHNNKETLKTYPENTWSKRKANFLVFFGGFEWIFSEIKREWIFPEIKWGMDFLRNQTGVAKKIISTWLD